MWEWSKMAHNTWKDKVQFELIEIRTRIEMIESKLSGLGIPTQASEYKHSFEEMGAGYAFYISSHEGKVPDIKIKDYSPQNIYQVMSLVAGARRAVYGYAMLLNEMGLSKDQKVLVRQIQQTIGMILRLVQTVRIMMVAMEAISVGSPWGIPFTIIGGGTFAASIAYGSRLGGGGV